MDIGADNGLVVDRAYEERPVRVYRHRQAGRSELKPNTHDDEGAARSRAAGQPRARSRSMTDHDTTLKNERKPRQTR